MLLAKRHIRKLGKLRACGGKGLPQSASAGRVTGGSSGFGRGAAGLSREEIKAAATSESDEGIQAALRHPGAVRGCLVSNIWF